MELEGRNALVIGAGSGIGRGIARSLVVSGMHVMAADVDLDAATETCVNLPAGGTATAAFVDATDCASLEALAARAYAGESLHLLVLTVGVLDMVPIDEIGDEQWRWAWDLNVMSHVRAVQVFLPLLRQGAPSAIVLTGSGSGLQLPAPDPLSALYATTKHALTGYFSVLREALAPEGIKVMLLVPSGVDGNLAVTSARSRAHHLGAAENAVRGQQPAGRVLVPASTIGDLVAHELREDRTYVSNRGAAFHQAMMDWLDEWKQDTTKS
ncbi:short-chain dehydrogenase [Nocardioides sp. S5]|uniref:SDR family NAD(P)-dependent oxidoreductase n=1 Tax=Nocardioides sp. S5 TaxID=2017486 RepID=UPI001A8F7D69|nr:SDR family oxidoreductase [Nocardioides sp. S5]QSR30183.1 short-chain dehydrogenase [Nocardioides sp. S5]